MAVFKSLKPTMAEKEYTADGRGFLQGIYVKLGKRVRMKRYWETIEKERRKRKVLKWEDEINKHQETVGWWTYENLNAKYNALI